MSSKIINMHSDFFANLIVDAASLVKYTDPKVRKFNDAISTAISTQLVGP